MIIPLPPKTMALAEQKVATLISNKVPTEELGGTGADSTKYLRGDQLWVSQPSVHAYRVASTQSISPLTYTKVIWNGVEWDTDNEFDNPNSRYVAKTTGKRFITSSVFWTSAVDQKLFETCIYKNGNLLKVFDVRASGTSPLSTGITAIIDMAINDYFEIYVYQNTNSSRSLDMNKVTTFLCIQKLL